MKKAYLLSSSVLAAFVFSLVLTGCDDSYSADVKYGFRTDPVLNGPANGLGGETLTPDRPNQLPILSLKELDNDKNPMHVQRQKILDAETLRDPNLIPAAVRGKLEDTLEKLFGTPSKPIVRAYDSEAKKIADLPKETQELLQLSDAHLSEGSKLYRIHCVHCHGVAGDGRGPTARWINPHPRDFRAGLFKFQSVDQVTTGAVLPPRRHDLLRTLEYGLEGTAMPAFTLLSNKDREALVSYVIHLSLRGKTELDTIKNGFDYEKKALTEKKDDDNPDGSVGFARSISAINLKNWVDAQGKAITVPPNPYTKMEDKLASIKRGQQLFTGKAIDDDAKLMEQAKATNCVSCHTDYGRQAQFRWDEWGTLVRPNNFTNGVFRGGRRPQDIYYRVHSGINGSGMANFGKLPPERIWDLVNFVQSLSYPAMRSQYAIKID